MSDPQPELFIETTPEHLHAEWNLRPGLTDADVRDAITAARRAVVWLGGPNVLWGFGPSLWRRLSGGRLPSDVVDFTGIGPANAAGVPVTQSDVWLWVNGTAYPDVWQAAAKARDALSGVATLERHQRAYKAPESRDPTGFIDGTENPLTDEALAVALVPSGQPGAGGSAVFVQRWVHDLAAFEALPVAAQEGVFGRTKPDSVQLPPAQMPATSHVSRNTVTDAEGEELHIYRRNTPFADIDVAGTMFIGATCETSRLNEMLRRMFDQAGDGLHDALIDFSTPTSGSWYYVPAMSDLTAVFGGLAGEEDEEAEEGDGAGAADSEDGATPAGAAAPATSSLGIGSLFGR